MGFQLSLSLDNNGSPTVIYKPVNGIPTLSLDNNGSPTVIYKPVNGIPTLSL